MTNIESLQEDIDYLKAKLKFASSTKNKNELEEQINFLELSKEKLKTS